MLKREIDEEIYNSYKPFAGFTRFSDENYISSQDLIKTYIDTGDEDTDTQFTRWVFDEFRWFPEGIYGEVIFFKKGGSELDYSFIGDRRKFLLIGRNIKEMLIDIEGCGWSNIKKWGLEEIFEEKLKNKIEFKLKF